MDIVNKISVDFTVLKEPRGFIRVLQFVLSIFTFATVSTNSKSGLTITCGVNGTTPVKFAYSYPFRLSDHPLIVPACSGAGTKAFEVVGNMSAPSQFFCFVGVMTFLFCILLVVGYVIFSSVFANDSRAATVDFIFSCVWTAIWFIASCAWADGVGQLSHYTNPKVIIRDSLESYCKGPTTTCASAFEGDQSTVIVSVLFGFLNFALWLAALWFLYKETKWHKEKMESTENFDQPQAEAQPSGDSSYQAPTY